MYGAKDRPYRGDCISNHFVGEGDFDLAYERTPFCGVCAGHFSGIVNRSSRYSKIFVTDNVLRFIVTFRILESMAKITKMDVIDCPFSIELNEAGYC